MNEPSPLHRVSLNQSVIGSLAVIGPAERLEAAGIEKTGKIVKKIADRLFNRTGIFKKPA